MNIVNIPPFNSKANVPVTIIDETIRTFRVTVAVLITTLGLGLGLDSFSGKSWHSPMSVAGSKIQFLQSYSEHRNKCMVRANLISILSLVAIMSTSVF